MIPILACTSLAVAITFATVPSNAQIRRCGVDRWPVKTLADRDSGKVDYSPVESTISKLGAISIPEIPYPADQRIAPHELRVYRVVAIVDQILSESDLDWHLVLRDPNEADATLIAEIPSPDCAATPAHAKLYAAARDSLRKVPRKGVVTIEGVGFFDFIHNQRGRARNSFELHPVLRISREHTRPVGRPASDTTITKDQGSYLF